MEGLNKKAFDFSQIAHLYDSAQHLPYVGSAIKHALSPQGLETTGVSIGGGEGVRRWFGRRGANLLHSGIEMGKNNQKMNPVTDTITHNWVPQSKLRPYHEGLQIGNAIREQGLTGDHELKYIQGIVDQKAAEREAAAAADKKGRVKDPVLNAFDQYQTGSFRHNNIFNGMINAGPVAQGEKALAQRAITHAVSAPIAKVMDPMAIARPIVHKAENTPVVNEQINKAFPQGTARGKMYSKVRQFID